MSPYDYDDRDEEYELFGYSPQQQRYEDDWRLPQTLAEWFFEAIRWGIGLLVLYVLIAL